MSLRSWSTFFRWNLAFLNFVAVLATMAQTTPPSRITQAVDDHVLVNLKGNVHPLAQARYDRGAVPDESPAQRMILILQRSSQREAALQQFLQDVHRPGSANYHKWLTPVQFGKLYGPTDEEVDAAARWLVKEGFTVTRINQAKTAIEFSGKAGQVRKAFHTEIHTYLVNGQEHHANNADPQIPAALAPIVAGLTPMNDFPPRSNTITLGKLQYDPMARRLTPQWTRTTPQDSLTLAVAPADFAVQYDLNPLYNAGITGSGVTIGIIGAADVDPGAIANYRSFFGLPTGTLNVVIDGSDPTPGSGNWATGESYLDVEVAGAVAPGATINLYTAADTSVQSGLLLAAQRAVEDDQATILSTSYGTCEQQLGVAGNQFWAALWEQAAAQGQTSFVSAGDSGSAGCDDFDLPQAAQSGLAVNGFSSTPWNVSVGGTDFFYSTYNEDSNAQIIQLATFWNLTTSNFPQESLLQPVPEQTWNDPLGLNLYDSGVYNPGEFGASIVAGSGGASKVYGKPRWQSGPAVPVDDSRDQPDVSLFAASGANDSYYPICVGPVSCVPTPPSGYYQLDAVGGTSASTPAMAGIMALINQEFGAQGQANYILYPLATQHPSVFHDITMSGNDVPCITGTPDCSASTRNDNTNGLLTLGHYYANAGYDEATGLGSVDANLLVQYWNSVSFQSSSTSLNISQTTFTHGTPVQVSVAVAGNGGTPSGDIGFEISPNVSGDASIGKLTLQNGGASATLDDFPGGQYQITAKYTGDTVFAPSNSSPVTMNVTPEGSTLSLSGDLWSNGSNGFQPLVNGGSYPYGSYISIDAQPHGRSTGAGTLDGVPTGTVSFTDTTSGSAEASGSVKILSQGQAEWVPAQVFPVGSNSLTASYSGDSSFGASSTSAPLTITVVKAQPSSIFVARPSTVALGSATLLNDQIGLQYMSPLPAPPNSTFDASSPASPTGTVTFSSGGANLGTVMLLADSDGLYAADATFSVSSLPLGVDTVTASYSGDRNYLPSTATFKVTVEQAATLTASANPAAISRAENTAITANVTGSSGLAVPTGTVIFSATGPGSGWTDTEPLNNGTGTSIALPGGFFIPGNVPIDVAYSGDATYGPADVSVNLVVTSGTTPPFALNGSPVSISAPGATTGNASTISVTPNNGFTGQVYLSCALASAPDGAQLPPTCSIPGSVTLNGPNAVSATMTINSIASNHATMIAGPKRWLTWSGWGGLEGSYRALFAIVILLGVPALLRRRPRLARTTFALMLLSVFAGCSGGSNSGASGGGQPSPGTTPGTYGFVVRGAFTVNGVQQAQTSVTVSIQ